MPAGLKLGTQRHGGTIRLWLSGELDLGTAEPVREALDQIDRRRPSCLVIDLRDLSFIDSSGLHLIVSEYQRLSAGGRTRLVILPGQRAVRRVFHVTGLDDFLPFGEEP